MQRMTRDEYRESAYIYNRKPQKLDACKVLAIRKNVKGQTLDQLATEYGVHRNTIHRVIQGVTWGGV